MMAEQMKEMKKKKMRRQHFQPDVLSEVVDEANRLQPIVSQHYSGSKASFFSQVNGRRSGALIGWGGRNF